MTKRQLLAQETRRKLIEATRAIVRTRGLAKTTVDEICASCGVAKGTFYIYFRKKEDVLNEVICREAFKELLRNAKEKSGTFLERLTFYMHGFSRIIEDSGLKLCQEWVRNTATPDFARNSAGVDKLRLDCALTRELFADAAARGEIRSDAPLEALSSMIVDLLYGQMLCWATSNGTRAYSENTREFCNVFLESILAPWLA